MADDKQYKSPEELGEAVGKKIEALFGGMFEDETLPVGELLKAAEAEKEPSAQPEPTSEAPPPKPAPAPPKPAPTPQPEPKHSAAAPPPPKPAPETQPKPKQPRAPEPKPADTGEDEKKAKVFGQLLDRIEALILNLEWETKPETVRELALRFKQLEKFFPSNETVLRILEMNHKVLRLFSSPGASPHPMLMTLLQTSANTVKQCHGGATDQAPDEQSLETIEDTYARIMESAPEEAPGEEAEEAAPEAQGFDESLQRLRDMVGSFEEMNQRVGKMLAVLRRGGQMSTDEMARRLSKLESLVKKRVGELAEIGEELSAASVDGSQAGPGGAVTAPDGLLLVDWFKVPLAIPSSMITTVYPLTESQAGQFLEKTSIMIANRQVPQLRLRSAKQRRGSAPKWLIHVSEGEKEFFLLAHKALGYRRSPEGLDIFRHPRIKIGSVSYTVLNKAAFR